MIKILINKYEDKVLICFLIGIIAILAISTISPANATTTTIDTTTTGGLKTAVDSSNNGDTITLKNGIYYGENNSGITINHNLKIVGQSKNNVILDAQGKNRFFDISSGVNVTLINLTFKNGYKNGDNGGAIYNNGTLSVIDSIFTNNSANGSGGAIYNYGNFNAIGSIFTNNHAYNGSGGAINIFHGYLNVNSSIFTNNFASGSGGAIYIYEYDVYVPRITVIYVNGIPTSNVKPDPSYFSRGNASVIGSIFTNNSANDSGGAIYVYYGDLSVSDSDFTNNFAYYGGAIDSGNISVIGSIFTNNFASGSGGAISSTNSLVNDSIFTNNSAKGGDGGAIRSSSGNLSVSDSIFTNNHAKYWGGAIDNYGNLTIIGSNFTNSSAYERGGAIYSRGDISIINDSVFTSNLVRTNNYESGKGGAIFNGANLSVIGSIFNNNSASSDGGAIYCWDILNVFCSTFINNNASFGGAIYKETGDINITGSTIINNSQGIFVNSPYSVNISFNKIANNYFNNTLNNLFVSNGVVNADYNWWGNNSVNGVNIVTNNHFIVEVTNTGSSSNGEIKFNSVLKLNNSAQADSNLLPNFNEQDYIDVSLTKTNVIITISAPAIVEGGNTSIKVTLKDSSSKALSGKTVFVNINNKNYSVVTNGEGIATLSISGLKSGNYVVKAIFNGDGAYNGSSVSSNQLVNSKPISIKVNTTIIISVPAIVEGGNASIKVTLKDSNSKALSGKTVSVSISNKSYSIVTNGNGVASLSISGLKSGNYVVKAIFNGDAGYNRSSVSTNQIVNNKAINEQPPAKAKVSANYKTGSYNKDIKVVLTANNGIIYYKIGNGNYKKYTKSITITKTSKIRFYAAHRDGNSAVSTYTYTIVKKPKISYSSKDSASGRKVTRTFTIKNKGSAKGSLFWTFKVPSSLKYVKAVASSISYYKYNKASKILTFGAKNLGAGKSTTIKAIFTKKK
ncbi:beta strand repeat-containing protein [Methanobrevibacter curvatus]|uniref:Putative outer membrane protein PmpI n=1 Tax=Methanobrevibacter curvatus TaxID=49547 RepID=A0A162FCV9_9EURY|nr:Ig-like domain-containing protein [Methanobrevibacter curvatus]KZX11155.1 putative outer membrane protein PmpI precursor [Methanobrevibacter curvatus]